jgi:hypothetical protein
MLDIEHILHLIEGEGAPAVCGNAEVGVLGV